MHKLLSSKGDDCDGNNFTIEKFIRDEFDFFG